MTLAVVLHGVAAHPYEVTRAATAGPDIVVSDLFDRVPLTALSAVAERPGVEAHSGPFPIASPTLRVGGTSVPVTAEGRDTAAAAVDQPKLIEGSWVSPGRVVIERSFADALRLRAGATVTLNGQPFRVAGIAVTAASPAFPMSSPGQIWVTRADARRLGAPASPVFYTLDLRLSDPSTATAFAAGLASGAPIDRQLSIMTAHDIQVQDATLITNAQQDLYIGATLLAGVLLAQNLLLAVIAATLGLAAGAAAAPALTNPGAGLIGAPGSVSIGAMTMLASLSLAVAVVLLASFVPARRAARSTTIQSLRDSARPPRRMPRLVALTAGLPAPLLVGVRLAARRPRRAILAAISVAITAATVVALLMFHQYADAVRQGLGSSGIADPQTDRDSQVLLVITVMLSVLAAINMTFIALAAAIDSRRPLAMIRAVGATAGQATSALISAQIVPTVIGAAAGVPLGIGLYAAAGSSHSLPLPAAWKLMAAAALVVLVTAGVAVIPARRDAGRPPGSILQAET
ncbi:MAG TPA: FtsX-like permease family protein [Jatrophihabitantaceae bacterium]|nr:FtsX-like permease family protein [Jatrophihabitantaceae bacterium]